jgi:general secretion pathway protein L
MADTLLVRLAPRLAGIRDWMLVDGEGQTRTPVQTGAPAVAVIGGARRVVVLVPGEDVALHAARVPVGRNRQRLLRAIPFALEEQLASDIEDLHFAIGKPDGDQYPVAVVERRQMDAWAKLLREAGISAHQWVPETLAVPHAGDGWDLLPDGERVLVRSGDCSGFTCDADTLEVMTTLVAAEERLPAQARVYGAAPLVLEGVEVIRDATQVQPLDILARGWSRGPVIDLLQGAYSRREEWGRLLRPWKATAALLLAGVLLAALSTGVNYYRLTQQQQQLSADIEALYKQTFPNARRIVNPRAQMEQELKRLQRRAGGSDAGFLGMFAATASVVRGAQGINVQGASYRDGRLDLELQADNLQLLDSLKQALVSSGRMTAEIQSATTEDNQKVKSRIRIEARAS